MLEPTQQNVRDLLDGNLSGGYELRKELEYVVTLAYIRGQYSPEGTTDAVLRGIILPEFGGALTGSEKWLRELVREEVTEIAAWS